MEEIIPDNPGNRILLLFEDKEPPRSENVVPITVSGYAQAVRDMQLIEDFRNLFNAIQR